MRVIAMPETETTGKLEFEEIFNTYSRFVYRTAYAVTGRHEDAEDVLQTIFRKHRGKFLQEQALMQVEAGETSVQEVLRVLKGKNEPPQASPALARVQ